VKLISEDWVQELYYKELMQTNTMEKSNVECRNIEPKIKKNTRGNRVNSKKLQP